jgi:hypothetical protein
MRVDLTLVEISLSLIGIAISIYAAWKNMSNYRLASKYLNYDISGTWYSAELDFKQKTLENAFLKVEIKRRKWGNRVFIKPIEQLDLHDKTNHTSWHLNGKIYPDSTLIGQYIGMNESSVGQGSGFLRFIGNGRAVGFWMGYSGNYSGHPLYGYWILAKNENDLREMAAFVLTKFQFYDIKYLVEHMGEKMLTKDYIKSAAEKIH